ncbi:MAG: photosynthetic reaction center cytochrome c subunit [Chloroflexaceae bacterium]|nr:photosynthetic reaction center cytochrome c subunit [Chloroflexaceae bacterium]NJO06113.1 photosynthetic reaction center cytochrome c subunit [Chloroflexaceae bacterium]
METQPQVSDRQKALIVTLVVGAVVAGLTIITFWWIFSLTLAPALSEAAAVANAPYNNSDGVLAITATEPNTPEDGREPWLGAEAWQAGIQAGQEYISEFPEPQNVQVLQGMNTSQIWNYMIQISGALGVGCQYCHDINNFAADPYPAKISGRLMLLLVRDLNTQYITNIPNWRGNYVRCDTCHLNQALGVPTVSEQFELSVPPITVDLEPLNEAGLPIRTAEEVAELNASEFATMDVDNPMLLKEAVLYYLYNYRVWDPFNAEDPTSGRGSLSLTHEGGRTQDQVTINQNVMNLQSWSLGVGCTYCHNSRNFYAYEADIKAPQFTQTYAINRLKAQHMMLMTTFMAQNWSRYVLPNPDYQGLIDPPDAVNQQFFLGIDDTVYAVPGCYTCHRGNAIPKASLNIAEIPEGEAGLILLPPLLRGTDAPAQ